VLNAVGTGIHFMSNITKRTYIFFDYNLLL
jgi:hypothetical protein